MRAALAAGEFEELPEGGFRVAGHELEPDEVLVERRGREGWEVVSDDGVTVALDTSLDDELRVEGQVLDLIHRLNTMRKEAGLELTDRITVTLPEDLRTCSRTRTGSRARCSPSRSRRTAPAQNRRSRRSRLSVPERARVRRPWTRLERP